MRKGLLLAACALLGSAVFAVSAAGAETYGPQTCAQNGWMCHEVVDSIGSNGAYTGHDEPAIAFFSNRPGSGYQQLYYLRLPKDPKAFPKQDGTGPTWNFQLHIAFWIGNAICDNQSAPAPSNAPCKPDSDSNIKESADPSSPDYVGKHAGTAFQELQFYPPGWTPWPAGVSCDAKQWCAALNFDSLSRNQNTNVDNNDDCLNTAGLEPVAFAFVTKDGKPEAPVDPRTVFLPPFKQITPDPHKTMFMGSGDVIRVDIHDTPDGLSVTLDDLTSGAHGSMVAGAKNHWTHVLYEPSSKKCHVEPYSFHPMYSTSSENTATPWAAASTYSVSISDELGHFEYCSAIDEDGNCTGSNASDPGGLDDDDYACFDALDSLLAPIGGCIGEDDDHDGPSYQNDWPGTNKDPKQDAKLHAEPIQFTSPTVDGHNYDRVAFNVDMPRIEDPDSGGICDRTTGTNCVNPMPGADFYPIYTTGAPVGVGHGPGPGHGPGGNALGNCVWRFGGTLLPGTTNTFGGNSVTEFGPILKALYPRPGGPKYFYNVFTQSLGSNPCPS